MTEKDNQPLPGPGENSEVTSSAQQTDLKIHQHLSDINDKISDQDLKDVRTDVFEDTDEAAGKNDCPPGDDNNDTDEVENTNEDNKKEGKQEAVPIVTPWNILGS